MYLQFGFVLVQQQLGCIEVGIGLVFDVWCGLGVVFDEWMMDEGFGVFGGEQQFQFGFYEVFCVGWKQGVVGLVGGEEEEWVSGVWCCVMQCVGGLFRVLWNMVMKVFIDLQFRFCEMCCIELFEVSYCRVSIRWICCCQWLKFMLVLVCMKCVKVCLFIVWCWFYLVIVLWLVGCLVRWCVIVCSCECCGMGRCRGRVWCWLCFSFFISIEVRCVVCLCGVQFWCCLVRWQIICISRGDSVSV